MHPANVKSMVTAAAKELPVLFTAVKVGMLPAPLALKPMELLLLSQIKFAPGGLLMSGMESTKSPSQMV